MVFTTLIFVFYFLPAVLALYYAIPLVAARFTSNRNSVLHLQNLWLLGASYVFYGWWNPWFVLLMLWITALNYYCGRIITRPTTSPTTRRFWLCLAVSSSLATLGVFKYLVFAQENFNSLLHALGYQGWTIWHIVLPVGISFYTFQALSYTVDLYRGDAPPARSLTDFACYIALFPQLVAGPIIRYHTVAQQLIQRASTLPTFASGITLFSLGFCKKVLLANPLGEMADLTFNATSLHTTDAWLGAIAYAFQIYFDFSGYSDMAVGLGRMIGFEFMKNFNAPYLADSITDFWRRWHISLSTFLRDYLYIPLGGNRHGPRRTYLNLTIVMLLGGLWHGAQWTFVIWGAYHGLWLAFERWRDKRSFYSQTPRALRIAITFVLVLFSWIFFRAANLEEACRYFAHLFDLTSTTAASSIVAAQLYTPEHLSILGCAALLSFLPWQAHDWADEITWPKALLIGPTFAVALAAMFSQAYNPFLYFQF